MADPLVENLILDLLEWIALRKERAYEEVMDAWRTSCPRLAVWEETSDRGLVTSEVRNESCMVKLTSQGTRFLQQARLSLPVKGDMERST